MYKKLYNNFGTQVTLEITSQPSHKKLSTHSYKVNIVYWKSFEVDKFCSCRTKLSFAGKHSRLDGSLAWQGLLHRLFHQKSFAVPIDQRKPQNFSTSNDLQCTVHVIYPYIHVTNLYQRTLSTLLSVPNYLDRWADSFEILRHCGSDEIMAQLQMGYVTDSVRHRIVQEVIILNTWNMAA